MIKLRKTQWLLVSFLVACLVVIVLLFFQLAKENRYLEQHPWLLPENYQDIVR